MHATPDDRTKALMVRKEMTTDPHEKTIIFYMTASHRLFPKVDVLSGVETGVLTPCLSAQCVF